MNSGHGRKEFPTDFMQFYFAIKIELVKIPLTQNDRVDIFSLLLRFSQIQNGRILIVLFLLMTLPFGGCKKKTSCDACGVNEIKPPITRAGPDQAIMLPTDSAFLDGSGSLAVDGSIEKWRWTKISGPASFNIINAASAKTSVTSLVEGIYQFELAVTNSGGITAKDTVQLGVYTSANANFCDGRPVIAARLVPIGSLSLGRVDLLAATANNKILFAGGYAAAAVGAVPSTRVDIFDIVTNTWSTAELSGSSRYEMGVASVGNKILFAGGSNWSYDSSTAMVDIYDALTNQWSTAELSEARTGIAAVTLGSKVFFAGGHRNSVQGPSKRVDIYDNATNAWSIDSLSESRYSPSAIVAHDRIYFAGGSYNSTVSKTIDVFDGIAGIWSTSMLQEPKVGMATASVGNKIFWASGSKSYSPPTLSDNVEIRDVNTGRSSFACITPRSSPKAVIKEDNIVFFTGYGLTPPNGTQFEIYNLTTETWSVGLLDHPIQGAAVIAVNNTIYIAGGSSYFTFPPYYTQVWKLEF